MISILITGLKKIANDILGGSMEGFKNKCEFFKYNIRKIALKHSKGF